MTIESVMMTCGDDYIVMIAGECLVMTFGQSVVMTCGDHLWMCNM